MLSWALVFLVVAIIAAIFGFSGVAGTAAWIAWVLFVIFLVLFVIAIVGILATIADEAMSWAITDSGEIGVTAKMSLTFRRPARVGEALRVVGQVTRARSRAIDATAAITTIDGGELVAEPYLRLVVCESGECIFEEGDDATAVFLVAEGQVHLSKGSVFGRRPTPEVVPEGAFFGETAFLQSERCQSSATAVERTVLAALDRPAWDRLIEIAPEAMTGHPSGTRRLNLSSYAH